MMKTTKTVGRREPALEAIARVATAKVNHGKHGPLFGEVSVVAGVELVRHFFAELLDRVLKKGETVRISGVGTFYVASKSPNAKRSDVTHRLAFSAAGVNRGLPKKGATP